MSVNVKDLEKFLNDLLTPNEFKDYGPNGLQVEGSQEIKKVAFAVSAQRDSIEKAVAFGADCMVVHHGLFWKFHGTRPIKGSFAKRVKPLIQNEINLFGYHLPLDAHLECGNAAGIAKKLGLENLESFGDYKGSPTGVKGSFSSPKKVSDLHLELEKILDHKVIHSQSPGEEISSMGIITGGANGDWVHCIGHGLDAYLTGEMSEHDWHESREEGIHMFAGGHNATEKFGVLKLKEIIDKEFKVETLFIDSENPA